jgi:hypothetical protein
LLYFGPPPPPVIVTTIFAAGVPDDMKYAVPAVTVLTESESKVDQAAVPADLNCGYQKTGIKATFPSFQELVPPFDVDPDESEPEIVMLPP